MATQQVSLVDKYSNRLSFFNDFSGECDLQPSNDDGLSYFQVLNSSRNSTMESLLEHGRSVWKTMGYEEDSGWTFPAQVQPTNYCDWNRSNEESDDVDSQEFLHSDGDSCFGVCNMELLRRMQRTGSDGSERKEFYVNNLTLDPYDDSYGVTNFSELTMERGNVDSSVYRPFPLLETILEETMEDLNNDQNSEPESSSPSSSNGPWGWGWGWLNSDDDSSSVIHVPIADKNNQTAAPQSPARRSRYTVYPDSHDPNDLSHGVCNPGFEDDSCSSPSPTTSESDWSERDQEVPKKRRRLEDDVDEDDIFETEKSTASIETLTEPECETRSPSVTESLIQFEALEKEIDDLCQYNDEDSFAEVESNFTTNDVVFRTSATSVPFEDIERSVQVSNKIADGDLHSKSPLRSSQASYNLNEFTKSPRECFAFDVSLAQRVSPTNQRQESDRSYPNDDQEISYHNDSYRILFHSLRTWSSFHNIDRRCHNDDDEIGEEKQEKRCRSACDIYTVHSPYHEDEDEEEEATATSPDSRRCSSFMAVGKAESINGGNCAVESSPCWGIMSEMARGYDDEIPDDQQWEPDGYLESDSDEYHHGSNSSDSDDYNTEKGDRFDDSNFRQGFHKRQQSPLVKSKMRSYRSFDSLHLIANDRTDDDNGDYPGLIMQSRTSLASVKEGDNEEDECGVGGKSDSPVEVYRSSPEQEEQTASSSAYKCKRFDRRRFALQRSVEALSEDSGYGDSSGMTNGSPDQSFPFIEESISQAVNLNSSSEIRFSLAKDRNRLADRKSTGGFDPCLAETMCEPYECPAAKKETALFGQEKSMTFQQDWHGKKVSKEQEVNQEPVTNHAEMSKESPVPFTSTEVVPEMSALLLRRKPKCRPAPLSLKEAEEFLNFDSSQPFWCTSTCHKAKAEYHDPYLQLANDVIGSNAPRSHCQCETWANNSPRCGSESFICISDVTLPCVGLDSSHTSAADTVGNSLHLVNSWEIETTDARDAVHIAANRNLVQSKFSPEIGSQRETREQDKGRERDEGGSQDEKLHLGLPHAVPSATGPDQDSHNCVDAAENVTCSSPTNENIAAMSVTGQDNFPPRVVLKRYGPHQEVEVYLSKQPCVDPSIRSVAPIPAGTGKGVHFSPIVSSVNWRESYLDAETDEEDNDPLSDPSSVLDDDVQKVKVVAEVVPSVNVQRAQVIPSLHNDSGAKMTDNVLPGRVSDAQPSSLVHETRVVINESGSISTVTDPCPAPSESECKQVQVKDKNELNREKKKEKPPLLQRFSLARLSARMSATFTRSDSKRQSANLAKKNGADETAAPEVESNTAMAEKKTRPEKEEEKDEPTEQPKETERDRDKEKGKEKEKRKSKNKTESSNKSGPKYFFSRRFHRSASSLPSSTATVVLENTNDKMVTSATLSSPAQLNECPPNHPTEAEATCGRTPATHVEQVIAASDKQEKSAVEMDAVAKLPEMQMKTADRTPENAVVDQQLHNSSLHSNVEMCSGSSTTLPVNQKVPVPLPRSSGKPPLPPQVKPRAIHARKHYLVTDKTEPAPPVPVISSTALQHALEHFKETARQDRERLVKSVPDLAVIDQTVRASNQRETMTSRSIDSDQRVTSAPKAGVCSDSLVQQGNNEDVPVEKDGRCRARQAAFSRASSVESAWSATLSKAAVNLSRTNIACSEGTRNDVLSRIRAQSVGAGLLETNLDADDPYETNLDELIQNLELFAKAYCSSSYNETETSGNTTEIAYGSSASDKKYKSMLNLGSSSAPVSVQPDVDMMEAATRVTDPNRAKSMEFLLDDDNKSAIQPPENELMKAGERQMSEHELRIQRSLQKLNVPEWFKNSRQNSTPLTGLRRRDHHGSSTLGGSVRSGGWAAFSNEAKTSSMTSLGSSRSTTPTRVVIPTRVRPPTEWRYMKSSRESLLSPASTASSAVVSPSISSNSPQDANKQGVFSWSGPASISSNASSSHFQRWGSGRLSYSSTSTSPAPSTVSQRHSLLNNRQPYLGWRSQEKLNSTTSSTSYATPAERLAISLRKTPSNSQLNQESSPSYCPSQSFSDMADQDVTNVADVRSSIREVTSAIVHYVTENVTPAEEHVIEAKLQIAKSTQPIGLEPLDKTSSRSPSPRRQRCVWLESSFVGPNLTQSNPDHPHSPSKSIPNHSYHIDRRVNTSDLVTPRPGEFMMA